MKYDRIYIGDITYILWQAKRCIIRFSGKYRRFFADICNFPLNICDPVTYMRSCFTNICDPVSQISAMLQRYAILFHKYMRSSVTNICDVTKIYATGVSVPSEPQGRVRARLDRKTKVRHVGFETEVLKYQQVNAYLTVNFKTIFLRILCISQKGLTDLCPVRKLLQCASLPTVCACLFSILKSLTERY